ncbi:MAG: YcxB family protein [Pyrinomonadaceae bacterium]
MTELRETLVVDVDLKESDLQQAIFWFRLGKWSIKLLLILLPVMGLLLLWRFGFSIPTENPVAATAVIVLIAFPVLYPLIIWFQTKRGFGNLQGFQRSIHYAFSADGYKVSDLKSSSDIDWETILRAAESKHSFHLFFHRSLFHTIPKRCFKDPEDVGRLRTLLKQMLGTKATVY